MTTEAKCDCMACSTGAGVCFFRNGDGLDALPPPELIPVEIAESLVTVRTLTSVEERNHPMLAFESAGHLPPVVWWEGPDLTPDQIDANTRSLRAFKAALRETMFAYYGVTSYEACLAFELAYRYGYPRGVRGIVQHFEDFLQLLPTGSSGALAALRQKG